MQRALTRAGHDALDVRDAGLRGETDSLVAARAAAEDRILVAADTDFSNALRFPPATHPGILVVRLPDEWSPEDHATRILAAIEEAGVEALAGAISIIEPARVRRFRGGSR